MISKNRGCSCWAVSPAPGDPGAAAKGRSVNTLSIEPTMLGLVLLRIKWTNKRVSLQVRPELEPTLCPSLPTLAVWERVASSWQNQYPNFHFRTQHLLTHPHTDCLSGRQFTSGFQHCPFPLSFSCPRESLKASCVPDFRDHLNISHVCPAPPPRCLSGIVLSMSL